MRRLVLTGSMVLGLSLIAVPKASALVFQLNDIYCNCLPAGSTAGGTVTLANVDADSVMFTVDLNDLLNFHNTNGFDAFAFSYSGTGTLSATGLPAGWALFSTAQGSGSMDGAGHSYEFYIDCLACANTTGVNVLTFTINSTQAITEASFELLNGNNDNFAAAVTQISVSGCTGVIGGGDGTGQSSPTASTGIPSGGGSCNGTTVPDGGATLGLLGFAMLGLGYVRRRLA
jgi:hypothetical protein